MKIELYVPTKAAQRIGPSDEFTRLVEHAGGVTLIDATGLWLSEGKIEGESVFIHQYYTDADGLELARECAKAMLAQGEKVVLLAVDGVPTWIRG